MRAGPNKYYKFPKCPECGAPIRFTENQSLVKFLIEALIIVLYIIAAFHTGASGLILCSVVFAAAMLICGLAFAAFGKIDYEAIWKYPKPSPYRNDDTDDITHEKEN